MPVVWKWNSRHVEVENRTNLYMISGLHLANLYFSSHFPSSQAFWKWFRTITWSITTFFLSVKCNISINHTNLFQMTGRTTSHKLWKLRNGDEFPEALDWEEEGPVQLGLLAQIFRLPMKERSPWWQHLRLQKAFKKKNRKPDQMN